MRDIIAAGLADLGLLDRVPEQAPSQLAEYGHLLLEKNQVMNLTAITDPEGISSICWTALPCSPAPTFRTGPSWTWAPGPAFRVCP